MINKSDEKLTLALETGIDGGSVAILSGEKLVCVANGTGKVSKSEDLLILIDGLLTENGLKKEQIGRIVVSDFPGSLTGIRIGLATAAGLGDSIGAKVQKISVLDAMFISSALKVSAVSALGSEKNGAYYCKFHSEGAFMTSDRDVLNEQNPEKFLRSLNQESIESVLLDRKLEKILQKMPDADLIFRNKSIQVIWGSPAEIIACAAYRQHTSDNVTV